MILHFIGKTCFSNFYRIFNDATKILILVFWSINQNIGIDGKFPKCKFKFQILGNLES